MHGIAPSRALVASTSSAGTKRNSASGSTKRVISHGQATRSTFTRARVTYFMQANHALRNRCVYYIP